MVTLGLRPAARALGISHVRLLAYVKEKRVPRNADGTFDVEAVRAAIVKSDPGFGSKILGTASPNIGKPSAAATSRPERAASVESGEFVDNLTDIRIKRETLKAQLDAFQVAVKEGALIWADDAERAWSQHIQAQKARVMLAISIIAPKVAPLMTTEDCQIVLERELRTLLVDLGNYKAA